jgi:hypothetical protein
LISTATSGEELLREDLNRRMRWKDRYEQEVGRTLKGDSVLKGGGHGYFHGGPEIHHVPKFHFFSLTI